MLTATPDARHCLQVRLPLRSLHDRAIATAILTLAHSAVLRSNTTMLFTVFGAAFGMQLYVAIKQDKWMHRVLMWDFRAYDTGSEKIWNSINKGVCIHLALCTSIADAVASDNGRTSSTGSWSSPRRTSRAAASYLSSEHNTWRSRGIGGWALYIEVYSTDAKYESTVVSTKGCFHLPTDNPLARNALHVLHRAFVILSTV